MHSCWSRFQSSRHNNASLYSPLGAELPEGSTSYPLTTETSPLFVSSRRPGVFIFQGQGNQECPHDSRPRLSDRIRPVLLGINITFQIIYFQAIRDNIINVVGDSTFLKGKATIKLILGKYGHYWVHSKQYQAQVVVHLLIFCKIVGIG